MKILRFVTGAVALALIPALGLAQAYPTKPVRIIAPFAAGTGPDANARELAAELTKHLGQSVFVENRPGASGIIGMEAAARSARDGYTLVIGTTSTLSTLPHLYQKLPFDAEKDFVPVSLFGLLNAASVANRQVPAKDATLVVAMLKKQPQTLNFATPASAATRTCRACGSGSPPALSPPSFRTVATTPTSIWSVARCNSCSTVSRLRPRTSRRAS